MTAKDDSAGLASPNFGHLAPVFPQLALQGAKAERYVFEGPSVALVKLRRLGEMLAQEAAARIGLYTSSTEAQADLLRRLRDEGIIDFEVADLFHALRKAGNRAAHDGAGKQEAELRVKAAAQAKVAYEELAVAMELASEAEANAANVIKQKAEVDARLAALQAEATAAPKVLQQAALEQVREATSRLELDEPETRLLIDAQLRAAGWEADTVGLTYKSGARPIKGRNLAIAEWPTTTGPADYVLFVGLMPIAVVEAKRQVKDVVGAIEQAKRYSRGYDFLGDTPAVGAPWGRYKLPFLFATNGRPYLRQLQTKSGIWFLDARKSTNHPRALEQWRTPQGLLGLLGQDVDAANEKLAAEPMDYLPLRDYQREAIAAVEQAIASGRQDMLLAMATGARARRGWRSASRLLRPPSSTCRDRARRAAPCPGPTGCPRG